MSLEINIISGTYVDESPGLQITDDKQDIALAGVPQAVQSAFASAGAALTGAIEIAGGGGNDVTVTGSTNGLSLVDEDGDALDGIGSGVLTHDGEEVFLYSAGSNVVLGRRGDGGADADGDIVSRSISRRPASRRAAAASGSPSSRRSTIPTRPTTTTSSN